MNKLLFTTGLILLFWNLSSCTKRYTCACDADGIAPIQNDYTFETEASNKKEASEQCRKSGDECGLYPL